MARQEVMYENYCSALKIEAETLNIYLLEFNVNTV